MRYVRPSLFSGALVAFSAAGCLAVGADNTNPDPSKVVQSNPDHVQLEQSRALVQTFGMQLKSELKGALEQGGPVQAVRVCKDIAPRIASELSRQSGAKVARTSLRYRNPGNAPESWQSNVLRDFDKQAAASDTTSPLEYFAAEDDGSFRYMRAIPADGICLACHGQVLAPQLQESIETNYPHDKATGYSTGDIRGAFSVTWPPADTHPGS